MGLRRILAVVSASLAFSSAAARSMEMAASVQMTTPKGDEPFMRTSKKDIYRMPNADAQYYKKHQHGIK